MSERNITEYDIKLLLESTVLKAISNKDPDVYLLMGFAKDKGIVLIINGLTNNVITVRNLRKKEKKLFEAHGGSVNE